MKSRKEIIQIVKHLGRRDRGVPDRRLMHPKREWSLGVMVWILLVCAGGAYAFLVFEKYSSISVESEMVEIDQLHYKRTDAMAAIESYSSKETEYYYLVGSNNIQIPDADIEDERADDLEIEGDRVIEIVDGGTELESEPEVATSELEETEVTEIPEEEEPSPVE